MMSGESSNAGAIIVSRQRPRCVTHHTTRFALDRGFSSPHVPETMRYAVLALWMLQEIARCG